MHLPRVNEVRPKVVFRLFDRKIIITYGGYLILVRNVIGQEYSFSHNVTCRNLFLLIILCYGFV